MSSSFAHPVPTQLESTVMPILAEPHLGHLRILSDRWQQSNGGRNPRSLLWEERQACVKARAAFSIACGIHQNRMVNRPNPGACATCGFPTFSWCEGCYKRRGATSELPFAPLCQDCDWAKLVCHDCHAMKITWQQGHAEYEADFGEEDVTAVEVTSPGGVNTTRIPLAELSERLGRPMTEIRSAITSALSGSASGSG